MTSKDIIIKLIDNKSITGEETYVLLNDILKGEMVAVNEALTNVKPNPWVQLGYTNISSDTSTNTISKSI